MRSHRLFGAIATVVLSAAIGVPVDSAGLFQTASGPQTNVAVAVRDNGWLLHRFEVKYPTQLQTVGGAFQNFNASAATVFASVVGLTGPNDFPNSINLSSSDVLGSALMSVGPTDVAGADFSTPLSLSLSPGWYGLAFGTGAFGAPPGPTSDLSMPEYAIDRAPTQNPISLLQANHPVFPNQFVTQGLSPRLFATATPPGPQSASLLPVVDALATLTGGSYVVTDGETSINVQSIPEASLDRRGIVEFDLSSIPRGSTINSASLTLNVDAITTSPNEFPQPLIYGYSGDGVATTADATQTSNLLLQTSPIMNTGIQSFGLSPSFFQPFVGATGKPGLLIKGSADGHQVDFATRESTFFTPSSLSLNFTPPPEPAPEPGDYNGNGYADTGDYTVWRDTFGSTTDLRADGNGDHLVNQGDYEAWKAAFANRLPVGIQNGNFESGDLSGWKIVVTPNASVTAGFPRAESFDVDGDGVANSAMRIRAGQVTFSASTPAGGGLEQKFILETGGTYTLAVDYASKNFDTIANTAPGDFQLLLDGVVVDADDLTGTTITPGQVIRGTFSASAFHLGPGVHDVEVLFLRPSLNSREIYGYFDNVRFTLAGSAAAVPEPKALTLALVAMASLLFGARRASGASAENRGR
jgi:hypothetical protein